MFWTLGYPNSSFGFCPRDFVRKSSGVGVCAHSPGARTTQLPRLAPPVCFLPTLPLGSRGVLLVWLGFHLGFFDLVSYDGVGRIRGFDSNQCW